LGFRDKEWQRKKRIAQYFARLKESLGDATTLSLQTPWDADAASACVAMMKPAEADALAETLERFAGFLASVARGIRGALPRTPVRES
jgi:hypothetical protein